MRARSMLLLLVSLGLVSGARAVAQEPRPIEPPHGDPRHVEVGGGDAQAELRRLFGEVERDLARIDRLLDEARAARLSENVKSRAELLERTRARGTKVIEGIDRILELAAQEASSSGGGSGGSAKQPGASSSGDSGKPQESGASGAKSPLDRGPSETSGRESTPTTPDRSEGGAPREKPPEKPGEEQGEGEQGRGPTAKPRDGNQAGSGEGRNERAGDPMQRPTGPPSTDGGARDRWGDLPEHARDVFRTQGGSDLPPRYRDWIDAYYRRLARRP